MSKIKKPNKKQPLRLGFIGGGLSSTIGEAHYTASHLDGHWQLNSGFFSRKKSVNYKTAKSWNVSLNRTYESLNKFISKETYKDKICNFFCNTYKSSTNLGNNAKIFEKKISNLN